MMALLISSLDLNIKIFLTTIKTSRNYLAAKLDLDQNSIKDLAFEIGNQVENFFFIAGSEAEGKAFLTCYISKNLVEEKGLNAGTVVRELGKLIQGGGGGQAFFATAGGKNPDGLNTAVDKVVELAGF